MCKKFGVQPHMVRRPESIDLLLSMRHNFLHPKPVLSIDGMTLYDGQLGKVLGGSYPDLVFTPFKASYPSSVHILHQSVVSTVHRSNVMRTIVKEAVYTASAKTDREFLNYFKEESIGVECNPRCGGCKCGKCATGAKPMSIKDEKLYEEFKNLMHLDLIGTSDDPGPYWRTQFPWTVEPNDLINNKAAITAVMFSIEKKLIKTLSGKKSMNYSLGLK